MGVADPHGTSALAQEHRPAEVVVVVDHNPEPAARVRAELPGVAVLENESARGASGTRNTGAFHSRTPLIAFLDDDTVASPSWLSGLVAAFADPAVIGAGGGFRVGFGKLPARNRPEDTELCLRTRLGRSPAIRPQRAAAPTTRCARPR